MPDGTRLVPGVTDPRPGEGGGRHAHARPTGWGAQGVDRRYNARRSGAPGPHAHGNVGTQVVDDCRAEVHGQRKPSNDPRSNQHNPSTPTTGHR